MSIDIHALSGAYAVDALDDFERIDFERHLAVCPACRDEVDGLCEAANQLAALSEATPPVELRAELLARISTVRPLPPLTHRPTQLSERRRSRRTLIRSMVAGTVSAAVAAVVFVIWPVATDRPAKPTELQRVMAAADVQSYSQQVAAGGSVTWYTSAKLNRVAVVSEGLGGLPEGKVYEVWLQDDAGAMVPAGFLPTGSGKAAVLKGSLSAATGAGITVEPTGGSPAPTSNPLTVVEFES